MSLNHLRCLNIEGKNNFCFCTLELFNQTLCFHLLIWNMEIVLDITASTQITNTCTLMSLLKKEKKNDVWSQSHIEVNGKRDVKMDKHRN